MSPRNPFIPPADQVAAADSAAREFLAEAEEIVDQLATELADLADTADRGELPPDLLSSIFRGAHSLKGLAGMFGYGLISELSHNMESLLDRLRLGRIDLDNAVMALLIESHELLSALIRDISAGQATVRTAAVEECVARIAACLASAERSRHVFSMEQFDLPDNVLGSLTEYEKYRLLDNLNRGRQLYSIHASFELTTFDLDLTRLSDTLKECGEVISTLPGAGQNIESHIDFDIIFGSTFPLEEVALLAAGENISVNVIVPAGSTSAFSGSSQPVAAEYAEKSAATSTTLAATSGRDRALSTGSMSRTVRVDISKLDELMNITGELMLAHSSITAVALRMRNEGFSRAGIELDKTSRMLERKLADLQKGVMEIRMIPVGRLYERMSRIVRKISREQGKQVELKFLGADTQLDKLIAEEVSDPLMHIVRNAIDHGIEAPSRRAELGKDESGTISISACQKGNQVAIVIEDDGSGIDIERVKTTALQMGLVSDVSNVSEREALDFIFLPGFSTSDTVSQVSGRGVGMDVVRNNIAAISGQVDIETFPGKGTRFSITLPITLAVIKALIVSCAGRTYALPITTVLESLLLTPGEVGSVERREVIRVREATLPLLRLENILGLERHQARPDEFYAIVVRIAEKRIGIAVDDLLGQQDIVLKSLGELFKGLRGISGAAELGDQRTILVLDVGGIIAEATKNWS